MTMEALNKWNVTFMKYLKQKRKPRFYRNGFFSLHNSIGKALQYVRDNPGDVCLAKWKPTQKSMKPAPQLSKD